MGGGRAVPREPDTAARVVGCRRAGLDEDLRDGALLHDPPWYMTATWLAT
jgi:hypothetical protein